MSLKKKNSNTRLCQMWSISTTKCAVLLPWFTVGDCSFTCHCFCTIHADVSFIRFAYNWQLCMLQVIFPTVAWCPFIFFVSFKETFFFQVHVPFIHVWFYSLLCPTQSLPNLRSQRFCFRLEVLQLLLLGLTHFKLFFVYI